MKKQEFIEKLNNFGFPKTEFVILSGGSLLLRGLREETADFDLSASEELVKSLDLKNCRKDEAGCYVPFEDVQMKPDMEGRAFDIIEGFLCQTLEDILALKRRLMRPKDIKDIEAIENFLKHREMNRLELHVPTIEELDYRQKIMSDPETMSYNKGYDLNHDGYHKDTGCIDFPESDWKDWYEYFVGCEPERFYAYIRRKDDGAFIGEVNVHKVSDEDYDMGILIEAKHRGRGYSKEALDLLLKHAFEEMKAKAIHNVFEDERDAAMKVHLDCGFREVKRENGIVHLMITAEDFEKISG